MTTAQPKDQEAQPLAPFDPAAPLPLLKPHPRANSWEPAARRYRDIEPEAPAHPTRTGTP